MALVELSAKPKPKPFLFPFATRRCRCVGGRRVGVDARLGGGQLLHGGDGEAGVDSIAT